jgi:hypothetical protein
VFKNENDVLVCDQRFQHDDLCTRNPMPFCFETDLIVKVLSMNPQLAETDAALVVFFGGVKFTLPKLHGEKAVLRAAKVT